MSTDGAYTDYINGRQNLLYHGIPVVDLRISSYLAKLSSFVARTQVVLPS